MSMAIIGAVVAVGGAVYGLAESSNQKRRGRHAQQALERERASLDARDVLPKELEQNQQLGRIRANTGLPSEQYVMAQKAIQRQQARTLKSATDRRMGLGLLASIDDNANRAQGNLDVANAQARIGNEKTLMGLNKDIASWKNAKLNRDLANWNSKMDYAKAVEGAGNQNQTNTIMSAINAAGLIGAAASHNGGSNSTWASGLFGNGAKARKTTFSGGGSEQPLFDANGNRIYLT